MINNRMRNIISKTLFRLNKQDFESLECELILTYIEHRFQINNKTSIAFIDLSSTYYGTVWRIGLL